MNPRIIWMNGSLVDESDVRISPFDHGLLVGDAVFETLALVRGKPFAVRRHLERLVASAEPLEIAVPEAEILSEALVQVAAANQLDHGRLRITVTSGSGPLGSDRGDHPPTVIVVATPQVPRPPTAAVATVDWTINEHGPLAGMKTVSYGGNVRALAAAKTVGASEAIMANTAGMLCEGTGSNIFVVHQGRLVTPTLASGCLAGITRSLVLELTDAIEEDVPLSALITADEAFLTSTTRNVQAIHSVNNTPLPTAPGPITQAASTALTALIAQDLNP